MPKYRNGQKPNLDSLIAERAAVGGIFSTKEAQERGISRQVLSYQEKQGRLERISQGVYRPTIFPETPYQHIVSATAAVPGSVIAGPSALAMQDVGHLESEDVWLRPTGSQPTRAHSTRASIYPESISEDQTVDLGGVRAESVSSAIATTEKLGFYDQDQIEEVKQDAADKGLI